MTEGSQTQKLKSDQTRAVQNFLRLFPLQLAENSKFLRINKMPNFGLSWSALNLTCLNLKATNVISPRTTFNYNTQYEQSIDVTLAEMKQIPIAVGKAFLD